MSFGDQNRPTKAIQIIFSGTKPDDDDLKVNVVHHHVGGASLKSVLLHEDFKDLKILVFSITGKARTGKSFLLNAMIKYLESNGERGWERTRINKVFEWKRGSESVTRGLWICPKIFKLKNVNGEEVGILLLDNQGLFDGEQSSGEAIAISGISTAISFVQMFNLKEKIYTSDLESIAQYLVSDVPREEDEAFDTRLIILVRDFLDAEDFGCGFDKGEKYISTEAGRGSKEHTDLWKHLKEKFENQECLLLPHPGKKILSKSFEESGLLCELDEDFVLEIDQFFRTLFSPENLIPHSTTRTGNQLLETLTGFDGKVVNEQLSFFNIMTEERNQENLDKLTSDFEDKLQQLTTTQAHRLMKELLTSNKNQFQGISAKDYASELERSLEESFDSNINRNAINLYKSKFSSIWNRSYGTEVCHKSLWNDVKTKYIDCFIGPHRQKFISDFMEAAAVIYYGNLRSEMEMEYNSSIPKTENLNEISLFNSRFISRFRKCCDFENKSSLLLCSTTSMMHSIWLKEQLIFKQNTQLFFHQKVNSLVRVSIEWLERATQKQYAYFELFTWGNVEESLWHWIEVQKQNVERLQELVARAWFKQSYCDLSKKESKEKVNKIVEKIKSESLSDPIQLSFIFLICKDKTKEFIEPIFKVKSKIPTRTKFVDTLSRVYETWEDFMKNNKLFDCVFCYPMSGEYNKSSGFEVGFAEPPAAGVGHKALRALDTVGDVVSVVAVAGCTAAATTTVVPAAALACAVAAGVGAGVYGLARGIAKITDKTSHKQSLSAGDVMNTVGNGLTVATAGTSAVAANLLKAGKEARAVQSVVKGLSRVGVVTTLIPNSKNSTRVPSQLNEDTDISTNYLLCFNSNSREEVIDKIRLSYNLSDNVTVQDILKVFVEANSIKYILENEDNTFVSMNIRSLVFDLVKPLCPLKSNLKANKLCSETGRMHFRAVVVEEICELFNDLNLEISSMITELKEFVTNPDGSEISNFLMRVINIESGEIIQFSIIFRSLIYSVLAKIEKASTLFSCVKHGGRHSRYCKGLSIYSGIEFHMIEKVFELINSSDAFNEISSIIDYLFSFMKELLGKVSDDNCDFSKFSEQVIKNWLLISKSFDDELRDFEEQLKLLTNPNCIDINWLLKENNIQGNLGLCLLKKSLEKSLVIVENETHLNDKIVLVPAWDGLANRLYCYSVSEAKRVNCRDLIKQLTKLPSTDLNLEESHVGNICILKTRLRTSSTYYIYQGSIESQGFGLIFCA